MNPFSNNNYKVGILGGGQLGRMFIQAAIDYDLYIKILDPNPEAPCHAIAHEFVCGSLTDYDTVMDFGKDVQVLTIEIENVNTEALSELEKQGVKVFPQPAAISMIQDKREQKQFYQKHGIPTAEFVLINGKEEIKEHPRFLPAVQKMGREGYDGKGVQVIKTEADIAKGFDVPSVLERFVDMEKEISVIIARNEKGETRLFPPVELVYHEANLVDYLLGPAELSDGVAQKANRVATQLVEALDFVGLLAVELFVTKDGNVLVNEIAPRPHNSGHQTIEANYTSQYEQQLRAILNLPLGSTKSKGYAAMVNLLGEPGHTGTVFYEGMEDAMALEGVAVHLYGKKETKPLRKMGHVTIIADSFGMLQDKIKVVKNTLKVKAL